MAREAQQRGSFGERLAHAVAARESQVVLGLDPHPSALWDGVRAPTEGSPAQRAAGAVLDHCRALIDAAGPACVAVKPQLACFERLGAPGREALDGVIAHARDAGLLLIADAKRGDIDVTAEAYAQSLFGGLQTPFGLVKGLEADLATVNPLLGSDAIAPLLHGARQLQSGILVLVRTSNPGAYELQHAKVLSSEGREPTGAFWEMLARLVAALGGPPHGDSGVCDVGAVVGATAPDVLARAREIMPHAVFLLPGVGAQGGSVQRLAPAFAPGRAGGLIAASRSIAQAHLASGGKPQDAARDEARRLRALAWSLSG